MPELTLRVCALYPDLLNIYADRGNLLFLARRCEWRGIGFELTGVGIGDELISEDHDIFYLGGGQDRDQRLCADDLVGLKHGALHAGADRGAVIFGVCGGYQLLGNEYALDDEVLPGLGLADFHTMREDDPRLVGNAAIEIDLGDGNKRVLAGFENHAGRTYLGESTPTLGRVLSGYGNNGADETEGVRAGKHGTVIGTYLHGPLLPKNAWFADWLIAKALGIAPHELKALDDTYEDAAHRAACAAAGVALTHAKVAGHDFEHTTAAPRSNSSPASTS